MGKIYDGIMGLIVADALGVPFEFKQRDTFKAEGMTGWGTYNQPQGTWSDDSSMTLATMDSIMFKGEIDLDDIMKNFESWLYLDKYTPHGKTFDVGRTTRSAIARYSTGKFNAENCGLDGYGDNGNGALMRILPVALLQCSVKDVLKVANLTHSHEISNFACFYYTEIARRLYSGKSKEEAVKEPFGELYKVVECKREEIKSTGFVVDTFEAALWCLLTTDNYKDCVLTAVNLGEDTDTVAAVAGGLAGILYGSGGENGIPDEWVDCLARSEYIKEMCKNYEEFVEKGGVSE